MRKKLGYDTTEKPKIANRGESYKDYWTDDGFLKKRTTSSKEQVFKRLASDEKRVEAR